MDYVLPNDKPVVKLADVMLLCPIIPKVERLHHVCVGCDIMP
jgi:hypothetical protein